MSLLAWLKGPNKPGKANYLHSEGACCSTDRTDTGILIHDECELDKDYVLRKAYEETLGIDSYDYHEPPEWCKFCGGKYAECVFCHTAKELIIGNTLSQKQLAIDELIRQCGRSSGFIELFQDIVVSV